MIFVIFGVPGVGKSSIVKEVIQKTNIKNIHLGGLMLEIGKELYNIDNLDAIRKLPIEDQIRIRDEATKRLIKLKNDKVDVLIETHAAVHTPQGYWPGISRHMLDNLRPDVFIFIKAPADIILKRREKDTTRSRKDENSVEEINEFITIARNMACTYAVMTSGTYFEVENIENNLDFAINKITDLINSYNNNA